MTKIISLSTAAPENPRQSLDDQLVNSAWQLAYAALWDNRPFSENEISRAQHLIRQYFLSDSGDFEKAFLVFCERILLSRSHRHLPMPSVWLHPNNVNGFTATLKSYQQVENMRQHIDGYQAGIRLFARSYRRSISAPVASTFKQCHRKLVQLREYALWQLFCQALCYHHFHNSVKP